MTTRPFLASTWRERGAQMECGTLVNPNSPIEADPFFTVPAPSERYSVYTEGDIEAERYKWIESEKVGYDLGETAVRKLVLLPVSPIRVSLPNALTSLPASRLSNDTVPIL